MLVSVDYLGSWEAGPGLESAVAVMRSLVRRGVRQETFVPAAQLSVGETAVTLLADQGQVAGSNDSLPLVS